MAPETSSPKGLKRRPSDDNLNQDQAEVEPSTAPKRQRVSRACDQCRSAREKCDGIQPLCFPCASQNRQCSWAEPKKKRGVQTGYIRTLELALGWIFDKIPGSEEALHGLLTHEGGQGRTMLVGNNSSAGNRLHRRWRKSMVHQEIDRVLSGGDATQTKAERQYPAFDDFDSGDDDTEQAEKPPATVSDPISTLREAETNRLEIGEQFATGWHEELDQAGQPSPEKPQRQDQPIKSSQTQLGSKHLRLPPNSWRLLDVYFSYTHSWFPVLEKALVHKTYWSYPNGEIALTNNCTAPACHAELWAALALASFQDAASQNGGTQQNFDGRVPPDTIYRTARSLIPLEADRLEFGHINALLLLALINIGRQELTAAWMLIGAATRIALSLGLHSGYRTEGLRRPHHAYMGCFILDTLVASRLHQPPHLRFDDAQPTVHSGENDQDEWDTWIPCPGFGDEQPQRLPSRSPSYCITAFNSLYGVHKIQSRGIFSPRNDTSLGLNQPASQEDSYGSQVQLAIGINNGRQPFSAYIISGGIPPTQLPSSYLLRLAFLCCGSQLDSSLDYVPGAVLQCVEEYISNFGACAISPLVSTYMTLVSGRYNIDRLEVQERDRWKKMEAAIQCIWMFRTPSLTANVISTSPDQALPFSQLSTVPCHNLPNPDTTIQQLPTPSYYADTPIDRPRAITNSDIYHDTSASTMLNYTSAPHARTPLDLMNQLHASTSVNAGFDLPDIPPQHFPLHGRPSFSSATFDYDAILDDIASLDRNDRMESDTQFMANLGFAPGSNLSEVLTHDFTGIS